MGPCERVRREGGKSLPGLSSLLCEPRVMERSRVLRLVPGQEEEIGKVCETFFLYMILVFDKYVSCLHEKE